MRIKRSIIASYIVVILIPVIIAILIGNMIIRSNQKVQVKDYVTNTYLIQKYSRILDDPGLYVGGIDYKTLIAPEDRDLVDIKLQNYAGRTIYSSKNRTPGGNMNEPKELLLSGLYEREYEVNSDSVKRLVFDGDEIIGVYTIAIHRVELINQINNIIIAGIAFFAISMVLLLGLANRFTEKRITAPINSLVLAMNELAEGRFVEVKAYRDDEIGLIINNFKSMRNEIIQKSEQLKLEQMDREYMVMAISHDLKTPLTVIRTNTELIRETGEPDAEKLDAIIDKCDYMKHMLDDLMNYNLLQSGGELELVCVDGKEVMETLFYGYEDLIKANRLEANIDIKVMGEYSMDVQQMDRVVGNLITNAIKYSEPGGRIDVGVYSEEYELPKYLDATTTEKYADRRGKLLLIFKNSTEKIPDDEIKKITYPFYKMDKSRNKEQSGTGLGLSIVVLIIDKHGGDVDFYSGEDSLTIVISLDRMV